RRRAAGGRGRRGRAGGRQPGGAAELRAHDARPRGGPRAPGAARRGRRVAPGVHRGRTGAEPMSRVTATDRLQRILAVLPWIVQHQGATVDQICERFGLDRKSLLEDLELVFVEVGLHPFTPDMLTDVTIEDDRVYVHVGDYFRRPLRLAREEALTLLAAGRAVLARPGSDPDGTLQRAVDKLVRALGEGTADR